MNDPRLLLLEKEAKLTVESLASTLQIWLSKNQPLKEDWKVKYYKSRARDINVLILFFNMYEQRISNLEKEVKRNKSARVELEELKSRITFLGLQDTIDGYNPPWSKEALRMDIITKAIKVWNI